MAKILLVEDDPDIRPVLENAMLTGGHDVTAVGTVKAAVSLIEVQPPTTSCLPTSASPTAAA